MAGKTFSAELSRWARASSARMTAITKSSSLRLINLAQSEVPVDTGFARASVQGSLQSMPQIIGDDSAARQSGNVVLVIANMKPGDTIYMGFTASYALPLEFGHSQQAPMGFVRKNAQKWPQIVAEEAVKARERSGG